MKKILLSALFACCISPADADTDFTGGRIDEVPIIRSLDIDDLAPGKLHRFYLQGSENGIGQHWLIPVLVAKGAKPGKRFGLQAGVHGDEINGFQAIHRLFANLDPKTMSGSVIAVVGANSTGLLANNRNFQLQDDSGYSIDFNRIWPGKSNGDAAQRQAYRLFHGIWAENADAVIDLHTQSTGTSYPLYMYADYRAAGVRAMAESIPADIIKIDPGEPGTAEQAFNAAGITSITLEIGGPKIFQPELIARAVTGIENNLKRLDIITGEPGPGAAEFGTFIGNETKSIRAETGGFAEVLVALNSEVKAGQLLAIQRNGFGDVVARYTAPWDGRVASIGTDPIRGPDSLLVRLIRLNTEARCKDGC